MSAFWGEGLSFSHNFTIFPFFVSCLSHVHAYIIIGSQFVCFMRVFLFCEYSNFLGLHDAKYVHEWLFASYYTYYESLTYHGLATLLDLMAGGGFITRQVSAKNGYGVSDAFYTLAVDIVHAVETANRRGDDERRGSRYGR